MRNLLIFVACAGFAGAAWAQSGTPPPSSGDMNGMAMDGDMASMPGMDGDKTMPAMTGMAMPAEGALGRYPMTREASGTSWQPDAAAHNGIDVMAGDWMVMAHATLWGIYDSQSGPRGDSQFFPAGMAMVMARRDFSDADTLNLRLMLSPDAFMGRRGYPLLLESGETANGTTALIDRQHPHDLFMEMAGSFSHKFTGADSIFVYLGYPGEPALGPPAFMHRASGMDDPAAPITHHWLDSTHVTFGVATLGWVHDDWKVDISQFTGREPDQFRFNFDPPRLDSTAARISYNPDAHWSFQASLGHLNSPEQLDPGTDETRYTASATYVTDFADHSSLAATLAWGLKHLSTGADLNGVLAEGEYKPAPLWTAFGRFEWEENNELNSGTPAVSRVAALSLGGIRDWQVAAHWKFGLGALYTFDLVPGSLSGAYGSNPHGTMGFMRIVVD